MLDTVRQRVACAVLLVLLAGLSVSAQAQDPRYWRLDDIIAQFDAWELAYPDIFHQTTLGTSGQGEPILLACISDNASVREPEPAIFFHAAQHANEVNGTTAVMAQMAALLEGYGSDPAFTARVDGLEIWFAPVRNPDGHRYVFGDNPSADDWRKTLRDNNDNQQVDFPDDGVDSNRNWDWRWLESNEANPSSQKYKGPYPWSEPEVVAARDFIVREKPVIVVDYHSPVTIGWSNYVFYPFQRQNGGQTPDWDVCRDIAQEWASETRTVGGNPFSTIYAYDTLPKEQCWVYGNTGILAYLMEIGDHCWYTGASVDTIGIRVARGGSYLLDRALDGPGISGTVTSAITGLPLIAEVRILEMHDDAIGPRYTDQDNGQFHRPTLGGNFTLEVSLRDHVTQTFPVDVAGSGWTVVDVELSPITTAVADVITDAPWLRIGDTLRGGRSVHLALPSGMSAASVELFDLRGRRLATLGRDLAPDRPHRLTLPNALADGVYLVRAVSRMQQQVARLVYIN